MQPAEAVAHAGRWAVADQWQEGSGAAGVVGHVGRDARSDQCPTDSRHHAAEAVIYRNPDCVLCCVLCLNCPVQGA
jgi:hypothetical protein